MSQTFDVATETVKAVWFGIMTDEEVRKLSFRKVVNPNLLNILGTPEPGGLYDSALGPLDEHSTCKSCGLRGINCSGHCGHIDLVSVIYHPLLFSTLFSLLQNTCFYCFHFRAEPAQVECCVAKLNLIRKGDIIGARRLETALDISTTEMSEDSDSTLYLSGRCEQPKDVCQQKWTSLQLTEAYSVLYGFMRNRSSKCKRCQAKNPSITKPTTGWIHLKGLSAERVKANIIRGHKMSGMADGDDENDISLSEVEDAESPYSHSNITGGEASSKRRKNELKIEYDKQQTARSLLPSEVRVILGQLWRNEAQLCSFICDLQGHQLFQKNAGHLMFFIKTILVPPTKFRPPAKGAESIMEHPQTVLLGKVLASNISLGNAYEQKSDHGSIINRWLNLQQSVNILFDSKGAAGIGQKEVASGICQLLEKKEGMFRQKMMGKRVNFACRSVISPDPCLAVNEIGIPPVFAKRLTYPERVTPWNATSLRHAINIGPEGHPGATHFIDKLNTVKLSADKRSRTSAAKKLPSSRAAGTQPAKGLNYDYEGKIVLRHLRNGDIVLVNRQPTLHKPSIIALKVRVLPGEKTIRFHYANCDSFNADFDGDEINVHFPQDEISRAEAYNIVNADNQYIVPTRGDPKRALIQDHIVSAVLLTKRDTFLTHDQFYELLYASGVSFSTSPFYNAEADKRVTLVDSEDTIQVPPPALLKPQRLWTGKQLISAILNHITRGYLPFTVKKRAKVAREYFGKDESKKDKSKETRKDCKRVTKRIMEVDPAHSMDEDIVFVYKNDLVQGVIDKEQFGKYGLVHTVQEMYGPSTAGSLLSVFSRIFTTYLQMHGFTCGVDDLLLLKPYEKQREKQLEVCHNCGEEVHQQFIGQKKEHLDSSDMQIEIEKAIRRNGEAAVALLDGMMRSKLNTLTSAVTKIFPEGLVKPFRKDCLSLMTLSGAKGGQFNFQQISLLLGQQELEGKRVPRMESGKTLPCFPPWDSSARAGGFISDRYLTGLRPQEFYFHCMAGREGLVDTAVKTSRSGYLQRCLIKNLENLKVSYDYTVREADASIVQFRYGEDGVDIHLKNYLLEFEALAANQELILSKNPLSQEENGCMSEFIVEDNEFPDELVKKATKFINDDVAARSYGLKRRKDRGKFVKLVKHKYFMSLAQPGEPVGVIAGQSIGEPSTQMTLNTFHHAGRGEMNVTLGIPRLQEILMTASASIRTPTMTCPLLKDKSADDAQRLSAKLKRITIADVMEKIEVSIVPFTKTKRYPICTVYKLKIKLHKPELYPPHSGITIRDCKRALQSAFVDRMEDAIENHMILLSKISGIKSEYQPQSNGGSDGAEDGSSKSSSKADDNDSDNDDDDNQAGNDDLGSDAQRSKRQTEDEMDYEEDDEGEGEGEGDEEGNPVAGSESEVDHGGDTDDEGKDKNSEHEEYMDAGGKKKKSSKSREAREFFRNYHNYCFELHYQFDINEPHVLLAQIAQTTAKKVFVKSAGAIEQCKAVELHLADSQAGGIPLLRKGKEARAGLQTAGVDFEAFWKMQDELDIRKITSNDIHAMLNTYGVEAARASIITEVFTVFNHYGVSVDMRHLTLIADFMTQNGGYRALNRNGGIAESISPFSKMTFETASKFLVESARFGIVDDLETPSSRITLGIPAKVGTGCFDLMHNIVV